VIEDRETFKADLYDNDGAGNCTIGFGHLVHKGPCTESDRTRGPYAHGITEPDAAALFLKDLEARLPLLRWIEVPLNELQLLALADLAYNALSLVGKQSTVTMLVNGEDFLGAARKLNSPEFAKVKDKTTGAVKLVYSKGVHERRAGEAFDLNCG
jgi:GH24 family phage-related lysozyme (muramidase)